MTGNILTQCVHPRLGARWHQEDEVQFRGLPIPVLNYDWIAFRDNYEPGMSIGKGATKEEAIADLLAEEELVE